MISTVSCAAAALRSTQNTCAPSRAKATAVALPLPQPGPIDPAPTTIATLPLSRSGIGLLRAPCIHGAQIGLEDLAVVVLRQRVEEHIVLGPLEARDRIETQGV